MKAPLDITFPGIKGFPRSYHCRDQLRLAGDPAQRVAGGHAHDLARRGDVPLPGGHDLRGALVQDDMSGGREVEPPAPQVLW